MWLPSALVEPSLKSWCTTTKLKVYTILYKHIPWEVTWKCPPEQMKVTQQNPYIASKKVNQLLRAPPLTNIIVDPGIVGHYITRLYPYLLHIYQTTMLLSESLVDPALYPPIHMNWTWFSYHKKRSKPTIYRNTPRTHMWKYIYVYV